MSFTVHDTTHDLDLHLLARTIGHSTTRKHRSACILCENTAACLDRVLGAMHYQEASSPTCLLDLLLGIVTKKNHSTGLKFTGTSVLSFLPGEGGVYDALGGPSQRHPVELEKICERNAVVVRTPTPMAVKQTVSSGLVRVAEDNMQNFILSLTQLYDENALVRIMFVFAEDIASLVALRPRWLVALLDAYDTTLLLSQPDPGVVYELSSMVGEPMNLLATPVIRAYLEQCNFFQPDELLFGSSSRNASTMTSAFCPKSPTRRVWEETLHRLENHRAPSRAPTPFDDASSGVSLSLSSLSSRHEITPAQRVAKSSELQLELSRKKEQDLLKRVRVLESKTRLFEQTSEKCVKAERRAKELEERIQRMTEENTLLRKQAATMQEELSVANAVAREHQFQHDAVASERELLAKHLKSLEADQKVAALIERMGLEATMMRSTTPAPIRPTLARALSEARTAALDGFALLKGGGDRDRWQGKENVFKRTMDHLEREVHRIEDELSEAAVREKSYLMRLCS